MTVLFAGSELEAFNVSSFTNVVENITSGKYDSTYVRLGIRIGTSGGGDWLESPQFTAQTGLVAVHWEWQQSTGISNGLAHLTLYDSSNLAVFRLLTATGGLQAQYWNGSAWTNVGSVGTHSGSLTRLDLLLTCGASFELYAGESLISSGSASMTLVTDIAKARWGQVGSSATVANNAHVSQCIVANVSTVNWRYYLRPPTGNGSNTAWTNDYTTVDEAALSDSDFLESTTANEVETMTHAAITLGNGSVKAVTVSGRLLKSGVGPQNAQFALRSNGTDYFSGNISGLGAGFAPFVHIAETDPDTGAAWTTAAAGSAATEFGVKSIA